MWISLGGDLLCLALFRHPVSLQDILQRDHAFQIANVGAPHHRQDVELGMRHSPQSHVQRVIHMDVGKILG